MRELEEQNAEARKELMQALFNYLCQKGVKAELQPEPVTNWSGQSVSESVIHLKEQNLNRIRLVGMESGGCGVPGDILRFQYEILLDKMLSPEQVKEQRAATSLVREGKVMNLFGGKVTGIKWVGQKLAERLNQDQSITADMMKCVESWNHMEFQIEAASPQEIHITGPRFTDPDRIAELYQAGFAEEIQCCLFGYDMLEKIARHIKNLTG